MAADCLVCGEVAGPLIDDELVFGFHLPPLEDSPRRLLGHLMVVPRRHARGWADLTDAEAADTGRAIARLARALETTIEIERVYSAVIGHGVSHLHVHVFPRYVGTPEDVGWMESLEWEGAPHGGGDEIAAVVGRLSAALA